jgi:CheY-like chemotaxis protein
MRGLVVEDDLATRLYLEGLLAKWGYHVTSVDDGARACEMLLGRVKQLEALVAGDTRV